MGGGTGTGTMARLGQDVGCVRWPSDNLNTEEVQRGRMFVLGNGELELIFEGYQSRRSNSGVFSTVRRMTSDANVCASYAVHRGENGSVESIEMSEKDYHHKWQGQGWEAEDELLREAGR
ncbi:MAG: hypothetical protein KKB21_03240 [Nanoarchaeota archaeon]|nr:hypothetical protein [Nanoarchaeota archaeon]MBU4086565.1 hypothetical protein [Nanoarchaeota archaeon]